MFDPFGAIWAHWTHRALMAHFDQFCAMKKGNKNGSLTLAREDMTQLFLLNFLQSRTRDNVVVEVGVGRQSSLNALPAPFNHRWK